MATSIEIIAQAQKWLGKSEKDGSFKEIIDVYNSHKPLARGYKMKYSDAWCAAFVSAVAIKCGATDIIPTECSCERMIELFKSIGSWDENDARKPRPGDIIFYDWQDNGNGDDSGWADHVGIVETVGKDSFTVIEGNNGDVVARRIVNMNAKFIRGFGVPKYDNNVSHKTNNEIAREVIAGKWGNGADRKNRLTAAGYNYKEVQSAVNAILYGSKKSNEEIAREVIAGKWGNGADRKRKLSAAGYDYTAIQAIVNKLIHRR